MYIASHDLQEPLKTIGGLIQLLKEDYGEDFNEEALEYCNFIGNSASRMQSLIKDLLEYSRIGQDEKVEEINTNKLIDEIKSDLANVIERTNASLEVEELPALKGSKTEFRLLFQNLISNAIKFRKPGYSPVVKIGVKDPNTFYVSDNGIGIEEKNQDQIFKIFKRLHGKSEYEGSGIGLAHCQKIVNKNGGEIWITSKPGEGSTFHFSIKQQ